MIKRNDANDVCYVDFEHEDPNFAILLCIWPKTLNESARQWHISEKKSCPAWSMAWESMASSFLLFTSHVYRIKKMDPQCMLFRLYMQCFDAGGLMSIQLEPR